MGSICDIRSSESDIVPCSESRVLYDPDILDYTSRDRNLHMTEEGDAKRGRGH